MSATRLNAFGGVPDHLALPFADLLHDAGNECGCLVQRQDDPTEIAALPALPGEGDGPLRFLQVIHIHFVTTTSLGQPSVRTDNAGSSSLCFLLA